VQDTCRTCFFKAWSPYAALAGLELVVFLPQPHEFWDYRYASLQPAQNMFFDENKIKLEINNRNKLEKTFEGQSFKCTLHF
jgi:hypothetical protein